MSPDEWDEHVALVTEQLDSITTDLAMGELAEGYEYPDEFGARIYDRIGELFDIDPNGPGALAIVLALLNGGQVRKRVRRLRQQWDDMGVSV